MAEIILGSVVESITGHLVSLISEKIGLMRGVRLELEKVQGTVSIIGGVLREAEKRQVDAEDVKEWLKRLRDVAYDADDLLDDFSTEALCRGRVGRRGKQIANEEIMGCLFISHQCCSLSLFKIETRCSVFWNFRDVSNTGSTPSY